MPGADGLLMAPPLAGGRRRRCATRAPRREVARAIEADAGAARLARRRRRGARRAASRRGSRRAGYERVGRARRAARALRVVAERRRAGGDRRRARRHVAVLAVRRRRPRGRGAPRAPSAPSALRRRRSSAPRASSPTRASWPRRPRPSSQAERDKLERLRAGAGRALMSDVGPRPRRGAPALARAVRHALRAGAHAPAADRARLARRSASRAVHVVGTNGKSSTVRMTAALLEAHGVRTGAYLSPHLTTFAERIRIGDADLEPRRVRRRGPARRRGRGEGRPHARPAASASPSSSC